MIPVENVRTKMHFYSFHVGDYRSQAGHLSPIQHHIYRWLLDEYHKEGGPIDIDMANLVCRLSLKEKHIPDILSVFKQFFVSTDEGWWHEQCEKDLEAYRSYLDKKVKAGLASGKARSTYQKKGTGVQQVLTSVQQVPTGVEQVPTDVEHKPTPDEQNHKPLTNKPLTKDVLTRTSSSELSVQNRKNDEIICMIPTNKYSSKEETYSVLQEQVDDWHDAYPDVDIVQQLKIIKSWNVNNPTKRKTHKGMSRHINSWLQNSQGEQSEKSLTTGNASNKKETRTDAFWRRTKAGIDGTG